MSEVIFNVNGSRTIHVCFQGCIQEVAVSYMVGLLVKRLAFLVQDPSMIIPFVDVFLEMFAMIGPKLTSLPK